MNDTRSSVCQAANDGWCSVSTTATADDDATALTFSRTASAEAESSPEVGSSRSSVFGSATSSTAMERRRFWPPLKPFNRIVPTMTSAQLVSPSSSSSASARCRAAAPPTRAAAVCSVSFVVSTPTKASSCWTYAQRSQPAMSPFNTLPLRAPSMRPARASSRVVLPLPDGPRTPQTCPPRTAPETSSRMVFCPLVLSGTLNVRPFQRTSQLDGCSTSTRLSDISFVALRLWLDDE